MLGTRSQLPRRLPFPLGTPEAHPERLDIVLRSLGVRLLIRMVTRR